MTSSHSANTCGTGTRDSGGIVGQVLCLWIMAEQEVYFSKTSQYLKSNYPRVTHANP
jgi:hypothetical protein